MTRAKVILNPYANRWKAQAQVPAIAAAFSQAGIACDIAVTSRPRQATEEALKAVQEGYDVILPAGGDGTVNEVVNGLAQAAGEGPTRPLAVLPMGTGNDFSDMAGFPRDLAATVKLVAAGKTRQVDLGLVNGHYFDNNCAVAMEPMVTIENIKMTRLSGNIRYVVALGKALLNLKAWHMHIQWDDGGYEGPVYLLSVCNSQRTGGLFYMAPQASMTDGLFDFVLMPEVSKAEVLLILARLFAKTHIHHPKVTYHRTRRLAITSQPGTPIHADGEVLSESAETVTYQILPGKLTILTA